nr:hypothetical protein [Hydrotalea flava]NIN04378.1 hypothetical protein [Hydrotalea flava]NIO95069.1 hypothetical protein [Hydrotalea flava]
MNREQQTKLFAALEQAKRGEWEIANDILGGFGIEFVSCGNYELKYINLGDTYTNTICESYEEGVFICSWGGWYEDIEQKICQEEGLIRCGYCGEFTPNNKKNWHDIICEN